jgi:hypothetical protein
MSSSSWHFVLMPLWPARRPSGQRENPAGHRENPRVPQGITRYLGPGVRRIVDALPREELMSTIITWARQRRLTAFFGLTFALSWWPWPFYAAGLAPTPFFAVGPLIAALVVVGVTEGRAGYRDLFARLTRWRVGWCWWVVAVATPLAVLAVAALANVTIWDARRPTSPASPGRTSACSSRSGS